MSQVLTSPDWEMNPSKETKTEYHEMCMILIMKLKNKSLREQTESELNNIVEFLNAIIDIIQTYPQEQTFKRDAKKMLVLRMKANYLLRHYNKAETDCLTILHMLEVEKESFSYYDEKYGGIGALLGANDYLNEEIKNIKNLLNDIRSHF